MIKYPMSYRIISILAQNQGEGRKKERKKESQLGRNMIMFVFG